MADKDNPLAQLLDQCDRGKLTTDQLVAQLRQHVCTHPPSRWAVVVALPDGGCYYRDRDQDGQAYTADTAKLVAQGMAEVMACKAAVLHATQVQVWTPRDDGGGGSV